MTWTQVYSPVNGSVLGSALVAAIPVVVLLGLLAFLHVRAHWAALLGLATALAIAVLVYGMPAKLALAAAADGAAFGLLPIGWIIVGAIFVYDVTVKSGDFEVLKTTIAGLASDRRIQLLLIGFSFGAFIEGGAGFGTPVAICGAMLIGLGFRPLQAAGLALLGNTAPVAFGALGTPIITLAKVTGLPEAALSAMVGRQLPFFSVLVPFWLIWAMAGRKAMREVWPACLTAGLSFGVTQYFVSNHFGPSLVDIAGSIVSILSLLVLLRFWQPKTIWSFEHESQEERAAEAAARPEHAPGTAFKALVPWLLLCVFVFIWGYPAAKDFLNGGTEGHENFLHGISVLNVPVPGLDKAVVRTPPVVAKPTPEAAVYVFNWLSASGTALLLTGIVSGLFLGFSFGELARILAGTLGRVKWSLLTIAAMLALGFSTRYAGLDATMGLAFASTGVLFPFFSPLLGWLGVALTGSDTSSNVLFGGLQRFSAERLGVSPLLACAANSSGGVMGKMIDAQSIVVAGVATGQQGNEGEILRYVFWHSIALASLVGVLVILQAYVFPWMVPTLALAK
ncbi:MAG TPA: L-lactate permease [Thermoanaerobaculia bacterium]|jgi:lactate permease|nr:L-lactate permease [Thermoanaerobaculia bacterium]